MIGKIQDFHLQINPIKYGNDLRQLVILFSMQGKLITKP